MSLSQLRVLHMAPEPFFEARLRRQCRSYITADISGKNVDIREDLTKLSFPSDSFDLVYASHVLEHIQDDWSALHEIRRVLSVGGIAILPVPIIAEATVEYGAPNPREVFHVRAPGIDYFDRYRAVFKRVQIFESASFDSRFQVWIHEDRSRLPSPRMPKRPPMTGRRHSDYIPVCYV
jgi:predicted SAM-dependent methyltransferase